MFRQPFIDPFRTFQLDTPQSRETNQMALQSPSNRRELSQIIEDVGGCLIVCVFIREMHSHAVTLSTKAH